MKKLKSKDQANKLLTETELELMTLIWAMGEGTVTDVIEKLPKERNLAYTSVSTILRILEQKGVLKTRKEGRGHIYIPRLNKTDYEARTIKHVVDRVFGGTPVELVRQLLGSVQLNDMDLNELRNLIDQAGKSK